MAVMISITALSIDMMLPALPQIGKDLHAAHPNDVQLVVSLLILGMGIGQIFFGPLSDCFGRKPIIFAGFIIFSAGCLMSIFAHRFEIMLAGRLIQGLGTAGPRAAIIALIRDQYGGRAMARIMSAIMAVFIFIPAVAPSLGQAILIVGNWRVIFGVLMLQGIVTLTWFTIRQPETLPRQRRLPFSVRRIIRGLAEVCSIRLSLGYTIASGFMLTVLLTYLNCAQQIFQEVFGLGREFPLYMAFLALCIGGASLVNSRIVMHLGMRALSYRAVFAFILLMCLYLGILLYTGGQAPLWLFMACFSLCFFCLGILFGNQNSIAMEPLGHIAGAGASVIGSLTSLISSPLSMVVGRAYNGSTLPLAWGSVILGILTVAVMAWADRPRVNPAGTYPVQ